MRIRAPRPLARPRRIPAPIASAAVAAAIAALSASGCSQASDKKPNAGAAKTEVAPEKTSTEGGAKAGPTDAASAPIFRLPEDVKPTRQRVELEVVPDRETFSGRVEIALELARPRRDLWVSSRELTFSAGELTVGGETMAVTAEPDDVRGAARVVLPREVPAGRATLSLTFSGKFNDRLVGLYRVKVGERWYAFTQFEAIDARRAFPSFDEPLFKIPWQVVLTVPRGAVAASNYPIVEEVAVGDLRKVTFAPTRPIASYLVALAVGEFDVVTPPPLPPNAVRKRPLAVRGLAVKGRGPELAMALRTHAELLPRLEAWFGTEYPYPKLDHVAVPDFQYGAMENVGLITYREQVLLLDPERASERDKLRSATTIAHEVAHQWFGNLVTMAWWDDLWLNESFANMVSHSITSRWSPENRMDLEDLARFHGAMGVDALASVRPIRPSLKTEGDIFGFDAVIAYQKGMAVLRMFERFLGEEKFQAGVRQYLAAHADGNATRDDLIEALSGQGTDVRAAMRSFIDQPGVPLVKASLRCEGGPPRVALEQGRNLPLGSTASRDERWVVPVCVRSEGPDQEPDCMLLSTADAELPLSRESCPAWIALNPGGHGYYRWTLPGEQLERLLTRGYASLSPAERLSLASNLENGLQTGALPAADVLSALSRLARDPEPVVAEAPGELLAHVRAKVVEPAQRGAVEAHMRSLYRPVLAKVGWKTRRSESPRAASFRAWLIGYLAFAARDPAVLDKAAAMGRAYVGTDDELHPEAVDANLTDVAVGSLARVGTAEDFERMVARLVAEDDGSARGTLLGGLAHFTDPALAERARALAFDERLRVNERIQVLTKQVGQLEHRASVWRWVKEHFDELTPLLPPGAVRLFSFTQDGCSEDAAAELEAFMRPRVAKHFGASYTLAKALEATRLCAAQVAAQRKSAAEFFSRTDGGVKSGGVGGRPVAAPGP